ncbi:MAG: MiaB/RimO family radical SAM methylthiotransferase [Firmicutes bacterium]|nr:MiaB/RimO family radical SAM methylthiotransferase [Bacillota bacterium]
MVRLITLGCRTNQAESDIIAKKLTKRGIAITDGDNAELFIINTCAVTGAAERKSRHEASKVIRRNPSARVVLVGCATQNNVKQFAELNVMKTFGADKSGVVDYVATLIQPSNQPIQSKQSRTKQLFVKVQDGCNNFCSYCIVPYLRGRSVSVPIKQVIDEINSETDAKKIIVLTGINLAQYEDNGKTILDVCHAVNNLNRPFHLSSLYIDAIGAGFISTLVHIKNFVPKFHLSIQTCSNSVLESMGRRYTKPDIQNAIELIRTNFKNPIISADIIVGFPTETEDNFNETHEFLKMIKLNHIHIFPYSPRTGTPAADMLQIKNSIITRRAKILSNLQNEN